MSPKPAFSKRFSNINDSQFLDYHTGFFHPHLESQAVEIRMATVERLPYFTSTEDAHPWILGL